MFRGADVLSPGRVVPKQSQTYRGMLAGRAESSTPRRESPPELQIHRISPLSTSDLNALLPAQWTGAAPHLSLSSELRSSRVGGWLEVTPPPPPPPRRAA